MFREFVRESLNKTAVYALLSAVYGGLTVQYAVQGDGFVWLMGAVTLMFVITTGATAVTQVRTETTDILRHTTKVLKAANRMLDEQDTENRTLRSLLQEHAPHVTLPTGGGRNIQSNQGV